MTRTARRDTIAWQAHGMGQRSGYVGSSLSPFTKSSAPWTSLAIPIPATKDLKPPIRATMGASVAAAIFYGRHYVKLSRRACELLHMARQRGIFEEANGED